MLKLKLQYFGHLMRRVDSLEKTLMLGGIGAGGEGDDRGWDGWMASPTRWTWVWVNSRSWWWTGRPGVQQFMGSQRVGHNWATELTDWNSLRWRKHWLCWWTSHAALFWIQFNLGFRFRFSFILWSTILKSSVLRRGTNGKVTLWMEHQICVLDVNTNSLLKKHCQTTSIKEEMWS